MLDWKYYPHRKLLVTLPRGDEVVALLPDEYAGTNFHSGVGEAFIEQTLTNGYDTVMGRENILSGQSGFREDDEVLFSIYALNPEDIQILWVGFDIPNKIVYEDYSGKKVSEVLLLLEEKIFYTILALASKYEGAELSSFVTILPEIYNLQIVNHVELKRGNVNLKELITGGRIVLPTLNDLTLIEVMSEALASEGIVLDDPLLWYISHYFTVEQVFEAASKGISPSHMHELHSLGLESYSDVIEIAETDLPDSWMDMLKEAPTVTE